MLLCGAKQDEKQNKKNLLGWYLPKIHRRVLGSLQTGVSSQSRLFQTAIESCAITNACSEINWDTPKFSQKLFWSRLECDWKAHRFAVPLRHQCAFHCQFVLHNRSQTRQQHISVGDELCDFCEMQRHHKTSHVCYEGCWEFLRGINRNPSKPA